MQKRLNTDPCLCKHWWSEHAFIELADDGVETPCKKCVCSGFVDRNHVEVVVQPGHDAFGTERALTPLCGCAACSVPPAEPDLDILLTVRDIYQDCMARGIHPEWTIGGATP